MQIEIIPCDVDDDGELILDKVPSCELDVVQSNHSETVKPACDWHFSPVGKILPVWVPACTHSVECQVDKGKFDELSATYLKAMVTAKVLGVKSLSFVPLGTNLFWSQSKSASAAAEAIAWFKQHNATDSIDMTLVFAVPKIACTEWEYMLGCVQQFGQDNLDHTNTPKGQIGDNSYVAVQEKEVGREKRSPCSGDGEQGHGVNQDLQG